MSWLSRLWEKVRRDRTGRDLGEADAPNVDQVGSGEAVGRVGGDTSGDARPSGAERRTGAPEQ